MIRGSMPWGADVIEGGRASGRFFSPCYQTPGSDRWVWYTKEVVSWDGCVQDRQYSKLLTLSRVSGLESRSRRRTPCRMPFVRKEKLIMCLGNITNSPLRFM